MMGGGIGVASKIGEGSRFSFSVRVSPLARLTAPTEDSGKINHYPGKRALLVDHDAMDRGNTLRHLERTGLRVTAAGNAADALLEIVLAEESGSPFDLIVCDVHVPVMDGLTLAGVVRSRDQGQLMPILFCGKSRDPKTIGAIRAVGHSAYLLKPIRRLQLQSVVDRLFGGDDEKEIALEQSAVMRGGVLVAEDNVTNQKVVQLLLSRLGCRVDIVGNGREAVEAMRLISYDLIFMDCQMPEMDGFAATRMIRDEEKGSIRTPIIALTANVLNGERELCIAAGMNDYLSKPVRRDDLAAKLQQWLPSEIALTMS